MADATLRIYPDAEIPGKLAELGLTGWYLEDGWLRRKYTTAGWQTTLMRSIRSTLHEAPPGRSHPEFSGIYSPDCRTYAKLRTF